MTSDIASATRPAAHSGLLIRPIAETDSIEELTDLLHRAYKVLADMGFRFFATHQTPEQTRSRISRGECYVGVIDGAIVATVTFYPPPRDSADLPSWYRRPDVSYFGQFAVEPSLQRSGIGGCMMDYVEELARVRGLSEIGLDTAEGAAHLRDYYTRRGYRFIQYQQWNEVNYRSVILSKNIDHPPPAPP